MASASPFDDARTDFATYFTNLASAQLGGYPGVLIGFDWPSNVGFPMAKKNAQATAERSFPHLATVVQTSGWSRPSTSAPSAIRSATTSCTRGRASSRTKAEPFDEILCIAAMLEVTAFNSPTSMTFCQDIVTRRTA